MLMLCHCLYLTNNTKNRQALEDACQTAEETRQLYFALIVVGFLASLINVTVLLRLHLRRKHPSPPTTGYLLSLAVAQLGLSFTGIFVLAVQHRRRDAPVWVYHATVSAEPVYNLFTCCTSFIILGLSADRYQAICSPHDYSPVFGRRRMKCAVFFSYVVASVLYLPLLFYKVYIYHQVNTQWYIQEEALPSQTAWKVWSMLLEGIHHVVPSFIIVILNTRILIATVQRRRKKALSASRSITHSRRERRTIYLLLAFTVSFLLTNVPSASLRVLYFWPGEFCYVHSDLESVRYLFNVVEVVSYTWDFFLYFLMNQEYRKDLCHLATDCCGRCTMVDINDSVQEG
ncbi:probable G-protein coupled receptor AH9.1 [Macrobrachium rosenbergii]|uniref:probable G-protein coupled receptor AH9.1 n=1 Tax=Macrobrachium rosenbergii TaxID=79674 RepID=UPI0034D49191